MWKKQSDSLIMGLDKVSIRFHCSQCGTLNTILNLTIPKSKINYDKLSESDSSINYQVNCTNGKCTEIFNIELTNAADGLLIQIEDINDKNIEYK
jgi:hypothetical protein